MRIATVKARGKRRVGLISDDDRFIQLLKMPHEQSDIGVQAVIELLAGGESLPEPESESIPLKDISLEAPLPRPRRNLWCVGRNYHAHAKELSASVFKDSDENTESWPIVFTKVPECVNAPFGEVHLPHKISEQIDYEAELAVVIGTGGKNIQRTNALQHVFGYTIVNDVTARDVQMRHQQWDMGKSFDTFCPMGPWIITAEEFNWATTTVRCWVNDELRQEGPTKNMIFDVPTLIETVSRGITLYPGDVIATGTPAGVGMGMDPPSYLKAGDIVRIEIEGVGVIENKFV